MTPDGYSEIGSSSNNAVFRWVTDAGQIVDNFSMVHGAHTLNAGLTIQLKRMTAIQWGQADGAYEFSGQFSTPVPVSFTTRYHALADLLLGYPWSYTVQTAPFSPHLSYMEMGYYFQGDWRITSSFTANVGLRWEYFGRPVERDNQIASFDLATGQPVFPEQNGYPRSLIDSYFKDLAPRIGLAWRGVDRVTVRAGYGIFYAPEVINTYRQLGLQNPFGSVSSLTVRPADPLNPLPVFTVEDPLAQASRVTTNNRNGIQRNLRDGQVRQLNLTLQYLITRNTLFEAAYHGSKNARLMRALDYNETNPYPAQPPDFALNYP